MNEARIRRREGLLGSLALLSGLGSGCSSTVGVPPQTVARQQVERRITGQWRLAEYRADAALSPILLLRMRHEDLRVRFVDGRVRSATPNLELDRTYRVGEVSGETFRLFIVDPDGLEYENFCRFEPDGSVRFRTITAPWQGEGHLVRVTGQPGA